MKIINTLVLAFSLVIVPHASCLAQENKYNWIEKRSKDGVTIFTSSVAGSSHKAVRAEMTIKGTVAAIVGLINDTAACPRWAILCSRSRVVDQRSSKSRLIYAYNDLPFPTANRDVVTEITWARHQDSEKVSMYGRALALEDSIKWVAKQKRVVRVVNALSEWHLTPTDKGEIRVESIAHIDPNGTLPAWLTNLLLINSPFKSMKRVREIVEAGEYSEYQLEF